ncbi:uncharacterized protein LOC127842048 isoform X3 [Dreissena polymorpha]|uniref:uncharacterized protein LOC127842048 isoform X2 n=1 Tax=Dreissena polymorpha TaxID=45954 RepID=UPI00226465AD|nr:uncharacterized protein LOC127842048 isoform X2 [Dreissena polymorpha]XP_052227338.1 uncharacterized protein LOC127842048 isoform X3 [Dreissena polymorpha]
MASLAGVFKEKERTNWLKAWLALDIAKLGFENFVTSESQNFHDHIYDQVRSTCTSCTTENVRKKNFICPMQICNEVREKIMSEHRYNSGSWNNTDAQEWQTNRGYCEIAKFYIQTDGYAAKTSFQEIDFNGVVSYMLNCKRFESLLSFPITTGKPTTHMPACLLYKAREIHKAVRHSADMKLSDSDLQDYFKTLKDLLRDPGKILSPSLSHDSHAQNAVKKLEELENDTLLLTTAEMMCLLEAVDSTLKQYLKDVAKDAVDESVNDLKDVAKDAVDESVNDLKDVAKDAVDESVNDLRVINVYLCIHEIADFMNPCKQELTNHADMHKHDIMEQTDTGKHEIKVQTDAGKQEIKEHIDTGKQEVKEHIDTGKHAIKEHIDTGKQEIQEHIDTGKQEIKEQTDIGKQEIKEHIETGKQEIKKQTDLSKQEIQEYIDTGKQDFDEHANKRIKDINEQFENTGFNETPYKQSCEAVYYQGNPMGGGTVLPTGQGQAMIMQQKYANYSQGYHTQSQGQPSSFPSKPSRRNQGLPHSDYQDQVDKLPRKPAPNQPQPRSYTQKQQTSGQAKNKALRKPQEASSEKRT